MMQRRQLLQRASKTIALGAVLLPATGIIRAQNTLPSTLPNILPSTPRPSRMLYLHGNGLQTNLVLNAQELHGMPAEMQGSFTQTRTVAGSKQKTTVRGVKLPALIERVGLSNLGKANWKTLLITATATDDYRAIFTWPELINSPAGEGVLVLHERDGQPLAEREGLMALQTTGDFRLGARHVRNLLRIEVSAV